MGIQFSSIRHRSFACSAWRLKPRMTALSASKVHGANNRIRAGFIGVANRGGQLLTPTLDFDDVEVENIKDCQNKMEEFLETRKDALLEKIRTEKALSDEIVEELKQAVDDFKSTYKAG